MKDVVQRAGMDILELSRFQHAIQRSGISFLHRILSERERNETAEDLYPILFSAKESLIKLTGGLPPATSFLQIEVLIQANSSLEIKLYPPYSELARQMQIDFEHIKGTYQIYSEELICTSLTYCN
ncbi:phosphopantetheine--protein transferase-like protein [Paenibacillus shirakamiensis]|uniref:Phosphopantetheine--protein transferase-like protein n=1 Tax=Paenibacillus shirakamiensis TaxID=1265935 RepID=A0ABS4JFG8_9BACL|nr:4'-phosphopantetheinyl transferase superfamily protein [Paenibacillus shirakamiensis]MBP2000457.1 phosphopantetheine--protein transferase-like protein [Paenibacillus shirakamiensis]